MLDVKFIRENPQIVKKAAEEKGYKVDVDKIITLDKKRRDLLSKIEGLKTQQNVISKVKGKPTSAQIESSRRIKENIEKILPEFTKIDEEYQTLMLLVPNIPHKDSPKGDETNNKEIKKVGTVKKFDFPIKDHMELGEKLNILDIERGVKIGGTRSYVLKNQLVILEQAVLRFALDMVQKEGFEIMNVPVLIKEEALVASAFFPFGKDDVYKINEEDQYLVGTSEASLVYYHAGETLTEAEIPKLASGISTCFRKEVGTYGKDNRGVIRVHQFNKVEQVVLCKEEEWKKMFSFILGISERIVSALELPYRIIDIATGDMGAKNIKQNDIEVWFPSQSKYRETHSCSYLGDYQARRANIKYRDAKGIKKYVHTLNNTAIATPRVLAAIIENNQQKDGSIKIPEALEKYTGFKEIR